MKFYFEFNIDDLIDEDNSYIDDEAFKQAIREAAINTIVNKFFGESLSDIEYNEMVIALKEQINKFIVNKEQEIINKVVDKVAENIAKKKAVLEMTPKASEFAAIDKANVEYFEQMIDKAIARKFK